MMRSVSFAITALILIGGVFGIGFILGQERVSCPVCAPEDVDMSLFWEAYDVLERKYIEEEKLLNHERLIYGAISGMVSSLDDPYTVFFTPEETQTFLEDVRGEFEGVGMEIGIRDGRIQVVAPLEGTPAQRAGLLPGDTILQIDGDSTLDITIEEAVKRIRGPKGTQVILSILRDSWDSSRDIAIIRDNILVPSIEWEMREGDIAYIEIFQFNDILGSDFQIVANEILSNGTNGIILDVRGNPGGFLHVAQSVASWFLSRDEIVVIEDFGGKREQRTLTSNGNGRLQHLPLVVLIDQGSASASEILAAALRDNNGAILIGQQSFGKGSVQELNNLSKGSSLKITIARWLTPNGEVISNVGLAPDIEVEMTEEDIEEQRDPQLQRAIEVISQIR